MAKDDEFHEGDKVSRRSHGGEAVARRPEVAAAGGGAAGRRPG
jgi:hypothetical protein